MTRQRFELDYDSEEREASDSALPKRHETFNTPKLAGVPRRQPIDQKALVRRDDGTFVYKRCVITPIGMTMPDDITQAEWAEIGEVLGGLESAITWSLADWACAAAHRVDEWGDNEQPDPVSKYQALIEETGYAYQTARDYAWVADRVPVSIRNRQAFFSHHRLVAPLYEHRELQRAWLAFAADNRLKVEALKREMTLVDSFDPDQQLAYIEAALSQGCLISQFEEFQRPAPSTASPLADRNNRRVFNRVWKGLERGGGIKREDIQHLRKWLDEIERGLA